LISRVRKNVHKLFIKFSCEKFYARSFLILFLIAKDADVVRKIALLSHNIAWLVLLLRQQRKKIEESVERREKCSPKHHREENQYTLFMKKRDRERKRLSRSAVVEFACWCVVIHEISFVFITQTAFTKRESSGGARAGERCF
jgi:hypothetical protein